MTIFVGLLVIGFLTSTSNSSPHSWQVIAVVDGGGFVSSVSVTPGFVGLLILVVKRWVVFGVERVSMTAISSLEATCLLVSRRAARMSGSKY